MSGVNNENLFYHNLNSDKNFDGLLGNNELPNYRIEKISEENLEIIRKLLETDFSISQEYTKNELIDELIEAINERENNYSDKEKEVFIAAISYVCPDLLSKVEEIERELCGIQEQGRDVLEKVELFNSNISQENFNDYDKTSKKREVLIEEIAEIIESYEVLKEKIYKRDNLNRELQHLPDNDDSEEKIKEVFFQMVDKYIEILNDSSCDAIDTEQIDAVNSDNRQFSRQQKIQLALRELGDSIFHYINENGAQSTNALAKVFHVQQECMKRVCQELQKEGRIVKGAFNAPYKWSVLREQVSGLEREFINNPTHAVFSYLSENGARSINSLAQVFHINHSAMKRLCEELQKQGKIEKGVNGFSSRWSALKTPKPMNQKEIEQAILGLLNNADKSAEEISKELDASTIRVKYVLSLLWDKGDVNFSSVSNKWSIGGIELSRKKRTSQRKIEEAILNYLSENGGTSLSVLFQKLHVPYKRIKVICEELQRQGKIKKGDAGAVCKWHIVIDPLSEHEREGLYETEWKVLKILREFGSLAIRELTEEINQREEEKVSIKAVSQILNNLRKKGKIFYSINDSKWFVKGESLPEHIKEGFSEISWSIYSILKESETPLSSREIIAKLHPRYREKLQEKKLNRVLSKMRKRGKIAYIGSSLYGKWYIVGDSTPQDVEGKTKRLEKIILNVLKGSGGLTKEEIIEKIYALEGNNSDVTSLNYALQILRKRGEIINQCKPHHTKWFVKDEYVPPYLDLKLRRLSEEILDILRKNNGLSKKEITEKINSENGDIDKKEISRALRRLQKKRKITYIGVLGYGKWFINRGQVSEEEKEELSKNLKSKILEILKGSGGLDIKEICERLQHRKGKNYSRRSIAVTLCFLQKKGEIVHVGSRQFGKWYTKGDPIPEQETKRLSKLEERILDILMKSGYKTTEEVYNIIINEGKKYKRKTINQALYFLTKKGDVVRYRVNGKSLWLVKGEPIPEFPKKELTKKEQVIFNLMKENGRLNSSEIVEIISLKEGRQVPKSTIRKILTSLKKKGEIIRYGTLRNGGWVVKDETKPENEKK